MKKKVNSTMNSADRLYFPIEKMNDSDKAELKAALELLDKFSKTMKVSEMKKKVKSKYARHKEKQAKEEKEIAALKEKRLIALDMEMGKALGALSPKILIIERMFGYALVVRKAKIKVKTEIEKGAGFQPYEAVNDKEMHVVTLLKWGPFRSEGRLHEALVNDSIKVVNVFSKDDLMKFVSGAFD